MHSFYEMEQAVKIKQEMLYQDRHTFRRIKSNKKSAFFSRFQKFFALVQESKCCISS
jgi:hypothetical protein